MMHTIDDLWTAINKIDKRLTVLETMYKAHIEKGQRKRETIAYIIATGIAALSLWEYFVL